MRSRTSTTPPHPGDYVEIEPGVWVIDASSRTDEIERVTGFDLPEGEYDTVAGLVLDRLERIPEVGDHVVVEGVRIEVLAVEDFAIQQLKLSRRRRQRGTRRRRTPRPDGTKQADDRGRRVASTVIGGGDRRASSSTCLR